MSEQNKKQRKFSRKSETQSIGYALDSYLKKFRIQQKFDEVELKSSWDSIVGEYIAERTEKIFLSKGKLFITLNSAFLKQELVMSRSKLKDHINNKLDNDVVNELIFL